MDDRENYLRTVEFKYPKWIPFGMYVGWPIWHKYREDLEDLFSNYRKGYQKGSVSFDGDPGPGYRKGDRRDDWGCLWRHTEQGLGGVPVDSEAPLREWKAFDSYQPPDLVKYSGGGELRDWEKVQADVEDRKRKELVAEGDAASLFDRLCALRGIENLMIDIAADDPHLPQLIDMFVECEMRLVRKWISTGVDVIRFHSDIGTQQRLMISPDKFRKYVKPMYERIFLPCRDAGVHVLMSSDGCLTEIVDDLVECGVSMHDPQTEANTLEGIEKAYKGKLCITLDFDRQRIPFHRPEDIKARAREAVERLSLPDGGLMISCYLFDPNTPLENIEAILQAQDWVREYSSSHLSGPE